MSSGDNGGPSSGGTSDRDTICQQCPCMDIPPLLKLDTPDSDKPPCYDLSDTP